MTWTFQPFPTSASVVALDAPHLSNGQSFFEPTLSFSGTVFFPRVASVTTGGSVASATNHTVTLPTFSAGDLLILFDAHDGGGATSNVSTAGWTEPLSPQRAGVSYRVMDGTEGSTVTLNLSASFAASWIIYRILAGTFDSATAPAFSTFGTGATTTPDPSAVTPAWGADNNLILTSVGTNNAETFSAWPLQNGQAFAAGTGGGNDTALAACYDTTTAGTFNPSAFTKSGTGNSQSITVAVRGYTAAGGATVEPPLYTNTQSFFGPTIQRTLQPALYVDSDTIFSLSIRRSIAPAAHTNTAAFFTHAVSRTLAPALHTNAAAFFGPTLRTTVYPALLTNDQAFFGPTITTATTISPSLHTNDQAFFSATLRVTLSPSLHSDGETFYTQAISRTLAPAAFTNTQAYFTHTLRVTLSPALYDDADTIYGPSILAGETKAPALYENTQSFFSPTIRVTLSPAAHTNTAAFQTQAIRRTVSPAAHTNTQTINAHAVSRSVSPALHSNAQAFFGPSLSIRISPAAYANGQAFFGHAILEAGTVTPPLYVNASDVYGPTVVSAAVTTPAEVMWPIASRPKWRRRGEAQGDDAAERKFEPELPRDTKSKRKWAKGTLRDALTEAGASLPEPLPEAPALQDPGRPSVTMAQMLAEQAALDEQARLRAEALRLEAIRRDDEEVIALFLSRF